VGHGGRYKAYPIVGSLITGAGLALLSTVGVNTPLWQLCLWIAVIGAGIGLFMQILVLVVQNAVDQREIGTATSANNFFREIGATVGIAAVGAVFTNRLTDRLAEALVAGASKLGDSASSLTPALVRALPEPLRSNIVSAYADSLTPIFGWLVPLFVVAALLGLFLKEIPLENRTSTGH